MGKRNKIPVLQTRLATFHAEPWARKWETAEEPTQNMLRAAAIR